MGCTSQRITLLLTLFASLWQPVQIQAQSSEDVLLERLLAISKVSQFSWSPSGTQIAYISNSSGSNQIHLLNLDNRESRQLTRHDSPVTDPQWSPDGKGLVFLTDPGWQERYEVWHHELETNDEVRLLHNTGAIQRNVRWAPDGSGLVLETNASGSFDIATWSDSDPVLRPLVATPAEESGPVWSPDNKSVAYLTSGAIWHVVIEEGRSESLVEPALGARLQTPAWSPDGTHLLFVTDLSGYWNVGIYSLAETGWRYLAPAPHEQNEPSWSADGKKVAFIATEGFDKRVVVVNLESGERQYITAPGTVSTSPLWNSTGDELAFLMSSPQQTSDLWLYQDGQLTQLTHSMKAWENSQLSSPESHSYLAREGFSIPALLYKPVNFDPGKRYPVVMVIHGGFYGQWVNNFDLLGQYLLQRGMVLFYPNPRGGGGYGRNYERLNDGDWGGGDVDDLLRGHDYLKTLPYVDDNHTAIWGGSYGGYLVYALVTTAPERFQAAVVRAGISDLRSQMLERFYAPARFNDTNGYYRQLGGHPDENPDFYRDRSPLTRVDRVKTPMLIMHGLRDNRVSPTQSWMWVNALRESGTHVELIEFPHEDHSLLRSKDTMREQLIRISALFEKYLDLK